MVDNLGKIEKLEEEDRRRRTEDRRRKAEDGFRMDRDI